MFRRSPSECKTAMPQVAADERVYAIGDVHGRADLLDDLLEVIAADAAACDDGRRTTLVLLGDYVDRGEDSAAVLERVASLRAQGAVCLRGNHELALLAFIDDPLAGAGWLEFGGLQTLASYGVPLPGRRAPAALAAAAATLAERMGAHLTFLRDGLAALYESGSVVFVHAALAPGVALSKQDDTALCWGDDRFLHRGWKRGRLVVHGHYAAREPVEAAGRVCIDTGACFTGRLTALRLDGGRKWLQAPARTTP